MIGEITKEVAMALAYNTTLYHRTMTNRDGSALRVRVSGKCKTWKRDATRFRLPLRYGLRGFTAIYSFGGKGNGHEWTTIEPVTKTDIARMAKLVKMSADTPLPILADALTDAGHSYLAQCIINNIQQHAHEGTVLRSNLQVVALETTQFA